MIKLVVISSQFVNRRSFKGCESPSHHRFITLARSVDMARAHSTFCLQGRVTLRSGNATTPTVLIMYRRILVIRFKQVDISLTFFDDIHIYIYIYMMIYDDTSYLYSVCVCVCQCPPQGCWYGTAVKMKCDAKNKTSPIPVG